MKKSLSIFYNGLKINLICQNENLFKEQYKMYKNFFVEEQGKVEQEINVYYVKSQKITDKLCNEIVNDSKHFSINPFEKQVYIVQEKLKYNRFMSLNKNNISIKHNNGFYIVVGTETEDTKYAPYTLILELISRYNETNNRAIFHSTGFTLNGKGILTIGESGSGKTTFLSKLYNTNNNVSFLSNDRVYVGNGEIFYFPIEIILSMGTVKNSKQLSSYFIEHKITDSWLNKQLSETKNNERCGIKPRTFCEINNINYVSNANLSLIVFPQIDLTYKDCLEIKTLKREDIIKKLSLSCFTPYDKEKHRDMWIDKGIMTENQLKNMADKVILDLAKNTHCISCKYGCNVSGEKLILEINREQQKLAGNEYEK